MKKRSTLWMVVALIIAIGAAPASALAKQDGRGEGSDGERKSWNKDSWKDSNRDGSVSADVYGSAKWKGHDDEDDNEDGDHHGRKSGSVTGDVYGKYKGKDKHDHDDGDNNDGEHGDGQHGDGEHRNGKRDSVTSGTYGSQRGGDNFNGLLKALDNMQDKQVGAALADLLLTKYDTKLTPEMKSKLGEIKDKAQALSAAADMLEKQGSVTDAVYLQKQAVKSNVKDVEMYKKLGKMYERTGKKGVKLYVNGDEPTAEIAPFVKDGNTLVPFRAISESLKATVSWNPDDRSVTVTRGDMTVKLIIDSKTATVNGKQVELEVAATIQDGNTVVPARFVSESLKATVKWEDETKSVVIYEE